MRGLRVVEHLAFSVRRNPVDDALLTRGHVQRAVTGQRQGPDVLVFGIEERAGPSRGIDTIDPAIGRRADEQRAVGGRRERMHFQLVRVEDGRCFAAAVDAEDLAIVAASNPHRTAAPRRQRPHEGCGRVVQDARCRAENEAAVRLDREVFDLTFEEVGLCRDLPERRRGRVEYETGQACRTENEDTEAEPDGLRRSLAG